MYSDDWAVFCPYSAGLQQLLRMCSQYGYDFDIKYNAKKSNIMIKADKKLTTPNFSLSGTVLNICNEAKYLGHYKTDDLSDDRDIYRQYRLMYVQAYTIIIGFNIGFSL